jgi:hypothetical protein
MTADLTAVFANIAAALMPAEHGHATFGNDPIPCAAFMILGMTRARALSCSDRTADTTLLFLAAALPLNLHHFSVTRMQTDHLRMIIHAWRHHPQHFQLRELIANSEIDGDAGDSLVEALGGTPVLRRLHACGEGGVTVAKSAAASLQDISVNNFFSTASWDMSSFVSLRRFTDSHCSDCKLARFEFPPALRAIHDGVFLNSAALTTLDMSSLVDLRSIGDHFCNGCRSLASITMPLHLETIGDYAFRKTKLATIDFSLLERLRRIGKCFCVECRILTSALPAPHVHTMGSFAFGNNSVLQTAAWQATTVQGA